MTPAPAESPVWPRHRWWLLTALIFAGQVGMIFWLAARPAPAPSATAAGPEVYVLRDGIPVPPGVINPTLLALPDTKGFSGTVWLRIPTLDYQLAEWQEPPRFLAPKPDELAGDLGRLVQAGLRPAVELPALREPRPASPDYYAPEFVSPETTISLAGDLGNRTLLSTFQTNSWPSATLLSNSAVQIAVDVWGRVVSPPVLAAKSGSPAADADALAQAGNARFEPLRHADSLPPGLTRGRIVFDWQTVPPPSTNAPAGGGQ
jgi:hypothetical protein